MYVTTRLGATLWRVHIAEGIRSSDPVAFAVCWDEYLERRLGAVSRFIANFANSSSPIMDGVARRTRAQEVHPAMLQAIDGQSMGASQREIASAIYGAKRVAAAWTPDSELRARIRYFLRRGRLLVNGGYRRLVYL
jgi:hypothetical protein